MPPSDHLFNPALTSAFVPILPNNGEKTICPNEFPQYETQQKIAIVGEAPGNDEMREGRPFIGASGNLLFSLLRRFGINRADCFVGNVQQTPAPEKSRSPLREAEVVEGIKVLGEEINKHCPNIVLLAGALALNAAFPSSKRSITDWRGSILTGAPNGICPGVKCLPTFNPAYIQRVWGDFPLFKFDLERFAQESATPDVNLPKRHFQLSVSPTSAVELLTSITEIRQPVALDIEGGVGGVSCISFAQSPVDAFIVPLATYSDVDKEPVLRALHKFLSSTTPKILQNQLYDNFVLSWSYKAPIRNVIWDTMLSGWEIYPELPKGLGTQVSIWTREPFYKFERLKSRQLQAEINQGHQEIFGPSYTNLATQTLHEYCCKDSACTYEIYEAHRKYFLGQKEAKNHFDFNLSLLPALLYMEQRGIGYDKTSASLALTDTGIELHRLQQAIDNHIESMWTKHGCRGDKPPSLNINSPKQVIDVLYRKLGYPMQHPKKGREIDTTRATVGVDALLELRKRYNGSQHDILEHILQWRKQDGLRETLALKTDADGRMRCGYNIVGTETGRLTCYGSPTGSGANLTTITKSLRKLYTADADHWFFQCDLSGADGWTVAAHCALRGDTTMLDDYRAGLKPAKIVALMMRHGRIVNTWSRERIREESKAINEDDPVLGWQYFACKRIQHGKNYGLGKDKMSLQILKDSYKLMGKCTIVSPSECVLMQDLYLSRYPGVMLWQQACKEIIDTTQQMSCASGHVRKFFGRRKDHSTYMEAYAHEPQANTTYATNLALHRLWTDSENRIVSSACVRSSDTRPDARRSFHIEPLHHVHDALCGQFRKSDTAWAIARIRTYFNNELTIAGRKIMIPFEGAYGPSWGNLGHNCWNGHHLKADEAVCSKCQAPMTGGGQI